MSIDLPRTNTWALGEELVVSADNILSIGASGKLAAAATERALAKLRQTHTGTRVYSHGDIVLSPTPYVRRDGELYLDAPAQDEVSAHDIISGDGVIGTIVDFNYANYNLGDIDPQLPDTAVIACVDVDTHHGLPASAAGRWRLNLATDFGRKAARGLILGVPLIPSTRMTEISSTRLPETPVSHEGYVKKLHDIMGLRPLSLKEFDAPRRQALAEIMKDMNTNVGAVRELVEVDGLYHAPLANKQDALCAVRGKTEGILNRFELRKHSVGGESFTDVFAVIWPGVMQTCVALGIHTKEEADADPRTAFVPLSNDPHIRSLVTPEN